MRRSPPAAHEGLSDAAGRRKPVASHFLDRPASHTNTGFMMMSLLLMGASAFMAAFLSVGSAIADKRQEEIRYAHDLALAIGGDYHCGYGLDMQAVRQAIDNRLAILPAAAQRKFRHVLSEVTAAGEKPDGRTCEMSRLLAARMGMLNR